jgi:hypothetical protein
MSSCFTVLTTYPEVQEITQKKLCHCTCCRHLILELLHFSKGENLNLYVRFNLTVQSDILKAVAYFIADCYGLLKTTILMFPILSVVLMVAVVPEGFLFKEELLQGGSEPAP